jgi:glycine/D-amino acid oxidase-like deaminating enzyme
MLKGSGVSMQVHPELFTKALIEKVREAGGELRLARLTGLETSDGRVTGVRFLDQGAQEETRLPADTVVLALGEPVTLRLPCLRVFSSVWIYAAAACWPCLPSQPSAK